MSRTSRRRLASFRRGYSCTQVIHAPSTTPLRRRDVHAALAPLFRDWIAQLAGWKAPAIGDLRCLVLSMRVTPDAFVYVSFVAEPFEPILWEVSSGRWHPPADEWLAGERSRRIEALGFTIGGSQGNYQWQVVLEDAAAVNAVVKTVVAIFYDAFEYRGMVPLEATLAWNVRAEEALTFEAFTPEDVMKVFRMLDFTVNRRWPAGSDVDPDVLRCRKGRVTTRVEFGGQVEEEDLYRQIRLLAEQPAAAGQRRPVGETAGATPRAFDSVPPVDTMLSFNGGVTLDWVIQRIQEWQAALVRRRRMARRCANSVSRRLAGGRAAME